VECSTCGTNITKQSKSGKCSVCSQRKGPPFKRLWSKVKKSAERKNLPFEITVDDFQWFSQFKRCHYCEGKIEWIPYGKHAHRTNLDRIIPEEGYIVGNLVVCCWKCNEARGSRFRYSEFCKLKEGLKQARLLREKNEGTDW